MTEPLQVTVDTRQVEAFLQKFPVSGPEIVRANLRYALDDALEYTTNQVVDRTPVNAGLLRGSIYNEVRAVRADVRGVEVDGLVSSSDTERKVMSMEWGRPPGKLPPIEAIAYWVRRKGLAGTYRIKANARGQHQRMGKAVDQKKQDLRVAWAIAISIMRKGTRGYPNKDYLMFTRGFEASKEYIVRAFDNAVDNIIHHWETL